MSDKESRYWLNSAIESFLDNVWFQGLQKFTEDSGIEKAKLLFGTFTIQVEPDKVPSYSIVTLSDTDTSIAISLNLEDEEKILYQIISSQDYKAATDLLYEIIDCWTAGFFRPEEA